MSPRLRKCAPLAAAAALGCGSTPALPTNTIIAAAGPNAQPVSVDSGINGDYANGVFVSVTACVPGTTTCQTIDHVLIDTGSIGLRLLASGAAGGPLTLALPQQVDGSGNPVVECNQFEDGFTWGPVRIADVKIADEVASAIPMQVIGDATFEAMVPPGCTGTGLSAEDTAKTLDANGVLGVGFFRQDCGAACATTTAPGLYYSCPASGCTPMVAGLAAQVQNPVWHFPSDNNGVIIELPAIPAGGQPNVAGMLVFGIGTQANNGLGSAAVIAVDGSGHFSTNFAGNTYSRSFTDSGSNGFFFPAAGTSLSICLDTSDFFCPPTTQLFTADITGSTAGSVSSRSAPVAFRVSSADVLNPPNFAFDDLAGPSRNEFDWGLPFFFGRNVFTAVEGQNTPAGQGPFVAY